MPVPAQDVLKSSKSKVKVKSLHPHRLKKLLPIVIGLPFVLLILLAALSAKKSPTSPTTTPPPTNEFPSPTTYNLQPTTPPQRLLSLEEISQDSDSDVIPDALELPIGTDPQRVDCLPETGCGQLPPLPKTILRPTQKRQLNLVYLLDSSGSMAETLSDGRVKIDVAKQALIQELTQDIPANTRVTVIVYGHQGTSSLADKPASCQAIDTLQPLTDSQNIDPAVLTNKINTVQAAGWTPLDAALQTAERLFPSTDQSINYVIVLSDGMETCGGQPAATADRLRNSGIQVTTSVVGLAVTPEERSQLEAIATAGGGDYYPADTELEVTQALRQWSEIARQWETIRACLFQNFTRYSGCVNLQYLKSLEYLTQTRSAYETSHHAVLPRPYYDLETRLWQKLNDLRDENRQWYTQESLTTHLNLK